MRTAVDAKSTDVERLLVLGRKVHRDVGRRLLVGHGWDLMELLDLGNWSARSLGRRQAWQDAVSIAVTMNELIEERIPETSRSKVMMVRIKMGEVRPRSGAPEVWQTRLADKGFQLKQDNDVIVESGSNHCLAESSWTDH